ncbi:MAG: DUF1700 domain-containing protein [Clostridia bacterium]|nr:DUF1700 domain-containing protein [Clostridia bacterium]
MNKYEFLARLRAHLEPLSAEAREDTLTYYAEAIDDRIEEGMTEQEAVAAMGDVREIADAILKEHSDAPSKRQGFSAREIVLTVFAFPFLLVAAVILLAVFIVLWSVVTVFYAAELTFLAGILAGVFGGLMAFFAQGAEAGLFLVGCGLFCAGLSILWLGVVRGITALSCFLTKKSARALRNLMKGRGKRR